MAEETRQETPTFTQVITDLIEKRLVDLHTAMPAVIVSYDYAKNLAVVQPALKRKFKAQPTATELPLVSNVPVCFPRMGAAHLRFPVNPGDEGELIFQERSIDSWVTSGGTADPVDTRKHHLSDAVFYPGLNSQAKPMASKAKKTSIELKNGKGWVEVYPNGKFKITDGSEELFDLMVQLCQAILDARTNTILGPQPLIHLQNQFFVIKTKLEKLRGQ